MKAQTQVVSVILIIGIAIAAIATITPWSMSMIQKRKDAKAVDDAFNFFILLDSKIRNIAQNGGEESIQLNVPGKLTIYPSNIMDVNNNSINFVFTSKVSNIAPGEWLCLSSNCNETATLGTDSFGVILGKALRENDYLKIEYKLWYRDLLDREKNQKYRIIINTTDNQIKQTTTPYLRIQKLRSYTSQSLTITEINIIV
ncbi:MAG: hypothetical protein KQA41_03180 [Candidatus Aenigmarchaeota archaeon]|nr:hypothetical protein [Candidatus Aenigmarchaeota archaeon]MBU5689203.1 hypothetical protein [Candidatus Aenigmarchaeota archaeon]